MVKEDYVNHNGFRPWYRSVAGPGAKGTPLLLLHGGPGSTHNYFELLDPLAEDRQVVSYDQLGCGNSWMEGRPELWRMETWVEELVALRKALGLREVVLLGQSWGGMLALEYVCNHPHAGVRGLVLSSTLPSSRLWGLEQARMIRQLPKTEQDAIAWATAHNDYSRPEYRQAEDNYMHLHSAGPYGPDDPECLTRPKRRGAESYLVGWGPNEFTPLGTLKDFDVTKKLGGIDVPTLIFSGGNDLCTPYIAKTMADAIPGARWELFRDARHMCFAEDTPRYLLILGTWLAELDEKNRL